MIKKGLIGVATATLLLFNGCASNGLAVNTVGNNKVDRYFKEGIIIEQKKVVIDDREMAVLSGAGIGAVGGTVAGQDVKGAAIGAVVGGLIGSVVGKEVIAYETIIDSEGKKYKCYLEQKVPYGSKVEFTVVDGKLKNVEIIEINKEKYSF